MYLVTCPTKNELGLSLSVFVDHEDDDDDVDDQGELLKVVYFLKASSAVAEVREPLWLFVINIIISQDLSETTGGFFYRSGFAIGSESEWNRKQKQKQQLINRSFVKKRIDRKMHTKAFFSAKKKSTQTNYLTKEKK